RLPRGLTLRTPNFQLPTPKGPTPKGPTPKDQLPTPNFQVSPFLLWELAFGLWPLVLGSWPLGVGPWSLGVGPLGLDSAQPPIIDLHATARLHSPFHHPSRRRNPCHRRVLHRLAVVPGGGLRTGLSALVDGQ